MRYPQFYILHFTFYIRPTFSPSGLKTHRYPIFKHKKQPRLAARPDRFGLCEQANADDAFEGGDLADRLFGGDRVEVDQHISLVLLRLVEQVGDVDVFARDDGSDLRDQRFQPLPYPDHHVGKRIWDLSRQLEIATESIRVARRSPRFDDSADEKRFTQRVVLRNSCGDGIRPQPAVRAPSVSRRNDTGFGAVPPVYDRDDSAGALPGMPEKIFPARTQIVDPG